ncbi:MAG: sulfotransferase [Cyanobacteria bacterium P01_G01_bin.39]
MNNSLKDHKFQPIFVVGNSRSGTTLMGSILGLNPDVFTLEELHFFGTLWSSGDRHKVLTQDQAQTLAEKLLAIQDEDVISHKNPQLFAEEAQGIIASLNSKSITATSVLQDFLVYIAHQNQKQIPCEQTPRNVHYIAELLELYPHCHIINMVRDPRDVLLSQKYKWKIRFLGASNIPYREAIRAWTNYHSITISQLWNAAINAAKKHSQSDRVITIRFEDLITQPEKNIRQVCEFLELEFSPQMLQVNQDEGGVSSHKKITSSAKGIDSSATGKWKQGGLTKTEVYLCQQITQENMQLYNYTIEAIAANSIKIALSWLFLPIKLALAVLFNLKRMKNIVEEIKKRIG